MDALMQAIQSNDPGLMEPPEMKLLKSLGTIGNGYFMTKGLGEMLPKTISSEAGSLFPEEINKLPIMKEGSKVGEPHAIYAYTDDFGPGMSKRQVFNIFGDPSHPSIKALGWGSSLPENAFSKFNIPIIGRRS